MDRLVSQDSAEEPPAIGESSDPRPERIHDYGTPPRRRAGRYPLEMLQSGEIGAGPHQQPRFRDQRMRLCPPLMAGESFLDPSVRGCKPTKATREATGGDRHDLVLENLRSLREVSTSSAA